MWYSKGDEHTERRCKWGEMVLRDGEFGGRGPCECIEEEKDMRIKMEKIQLLSSSSVAVSTSQDFDDNATITAFWEEKINSIRKIGILQNLKKKQRYTYFFKAHGTEFVYFACVFWTGNGSACVDVRPESCCLFEHLWVLLVL